MSTKSFKSVNQQITILKSRGMKFKSIPNAKEILKRKNYYNIINGCKNLIIDSNSSVEKYKDDLYFEETVEILKFDHNLRYLFLKYILIIEEEFRRHIAYEFAKFEGPENWDSLNSFDCSTSKQILYVNSLISRLNDNANRSRNDSHDDMLNHFNSNGKVPIWALVNTFDFGTLKKFYINSRQSLKNTISNTYYNVTFSNLKSFLENLNMYRNVCAHDFRILYYRIFDLDKQISDMDVHNNMNIKRNQYGNYLYGKNDLFSVVIVFKYMLSEKEFVEFMTQLKLIIDNLSSILNVISINEVLEAIGFPQQNNNQKDWYEILTVDK